MDTNVAVVANGREWHAASRCVIKCLDELKKIQTGRRLLLDDAGFILQEYLKQKPHGSPQGPGDAFLVWVYDNQANPEHVEVIPVTPLPCESRGFREFPDDSELRTFDRDDRKFVAVALASGVKPPILNASDTDWWIHRVALTRNGVRVKFLCPCLMSDGV